VYAFANPAQHGFQVHYVAPESYRETT
jgi:hypothetical protein